MQEVARRRKWSRFLAAAPLSVLALMNAGWSNSLRPLHEGQDARVLEEDSQYMGRVFAAQKNGGENGFIHIDMADESQYRFVLTRLNAAGKTDVNAPYLFRRLEGARQRALQRKANPQGSGASLTSTSWGCVHYVTLMPGAATTTNRSYKSGPVGTCEGGANYMYVDVLFNNSNLTGGDRVVVASNAGEEYSGGTNFAEVQVRPSMPLSSIRQSDVDSMMIAMNDTTGEEVITFLRAQSGSTFSPAKITLSHPSFAGEVKSNISLCQLRGGDDCDYAVVSQQGTTLVPWSTSPIGIAQRRTKSPWTGNSNALFRFHSGVSFDTAHVFLPLKFSFDAGMGTSRACTITSLTTDTKAELVRSRGGGACRTTTDLIPNMVVSGRNATHDKLVNFNRNVVSPTGNQCTMASITNEEMSLIFRVAATMDCGQGPEQRSVTYRSRDEWEWNLYILNSCMAAGTGIERADGTSATVEEIRVGDKVVANDKGLVLTVTDVQRGGEDKPLVHLRDDQGHDVRLTTEHPVVLASGKVMKAEAVKAKDRVRTRQGVASIVSVTRVPYDGQVYNLTLGTPEELAKVSKQERTLFAGGFQVGDSSMQFDLTAPRLASGDVLTRLPKAWHRDFKNRLTVQ